VKCASSSDKTLNESSRIWTERLQKTAYRAQKESDPMLSVQATHHFLFGVPVTVLLAPFSTAFLTAPVSTILPYNNSTIRCADATDTFYNETMTSQHRADNANTHFCLISVSTTFVNNLTQTIVYRSFILDIGQPGIAIASTVNAFSSTTFHQHYRLSRSQSE
jgi:hypothetical protein